MVDVVESDVNGALGILAAVGGFCVGFACFIADTVIEAIVVRRLHREHPETWESLGRPGVPFATLSGTTWEGRSRARTLGALWRWAWRVPDALSGDARLQQLARAHVVVSSLGFLSLGLFAVLLFRATSG